MASFALALRAKSLDKNKWEAFRVVGNLARALRLKDCIKGKAGLPKV